MTQAPLELAERVIALLEQARARLVRSVNSGMMITYWSIGREIVQALQGGEERAEYGKEVINTLSQQLTERYGKGYSAQTLWNFRQFYLTYPDRLEILSPSGRELIPLANLSLSGRDLQTTGIEPALRQGFSPQLTWSHYRALMRVQNIQAREFYEREAAECGWSKQQLERQIQTAYYERILANQGEQGLVSQERERLPGDAMEPIHLLKSPMVLEFLDLPDTPRLHESHLEQAIIDNLQAFLLELGKGFSFVARQKLIRFDDDEFYVDLVFYNFILKCFVLIDLKLGKLTHADVGQMDGYVRLFEDRFKVEGDNPTVGLILCSDKSESVARYSVLNEGRQIFASKYLRFLPSEEMLRQEIEKERRFLESKIGEDRS